VSLFFVLVFFSFQPRLFLSNNPGLPKEITVDSLMSFDQTQKLLEKCAKFEEERILRSVNELKRLSLPSRCVSWLHQQHAFMLDVQSSMAEVASPTLRAVQARVESACKSLKRESVRSADSSLDKLQAQICSNLPSVMPSAEDTQKRHQLRLELRAMIDGERDAIGEALLAISQEQELLGPEVAGSQNVVRDKSLEDLQELVLKYQSNAEAIRGLCCVLEKDEVDLAQSKWRNGKREELAELRKRIAKQEKELESLLVMSIDVDCLGRAQAQVSAVQQERRRENCISWQRKCRSMRCD
jgi:hypothetical protein